MFVLPKDVFVLCLAQGAGCGVHGALGGKGWKRGIARCNRFRWPLGFSLLQGHVKLKSYSMVSISDVLGGHGGRCCLLNLKRLYLILGGMLGTSGGLWGSLTAFPKGRGILGFRWPLWCMSSKISVGWFGIAGWLLCFIFHLICVI